MTRRGGPPPSRSARPLRALAVAMLLAAPASAGPTTAPTRAARRSDALQSRKPHDTSGWVGANYTPAYCVNQVQMWHEFRPDVIDRELAAAERHFALTTLRVFLHNLVYDAEKVKLLERMDRFLAICERHGIRPGFVFFDDCHRRDGIFLSPQKPPVDGYHNGRWAACPQGRERKDQNLPKLKAYVQDVIRRFRTDRRVLWWEIYNEPDRKSPFSQRLRRLGYQWAKELKPVQPVLCCWNDSPETDIVDAHNYNDNFAGWDRQADLNPAKGTLFTEAGARWYGRRGRSNGSPIEVIHWLRRRRAARKSVPGVCLCWELMVGNSNCRWYWGTKHGSPEPPIPWCGLLLPDGTPVSLAEAEAVRSYVTGKTRAMLFEDFQAVPETPAPPGWKRYGAAGRGSRGYLALGPHRKMIADKPTWGDYVLEAAVMLKSDAGNAGLVFRVSAAGHGPDEMRGYYVGFDCRTLYLGRMRNNWQPLATFDLRKLSGGRSKIVPDVWNRLRVAAEGRRIRVWLNPLHDDPGLRIDHTDTALRSSASLRSTSKVGALLTGPPRRIGLRTHNVSAWFDDVVVLPLDALPKAAAPSK